MTTRTALATLRGVPSIATELAAFVTAATARLVVLLIAALQLQACQGSSKSTEIYWRLVDAHSTETAPGEPAVLATRDADGSPQPRGPSRAVIADDMRYTFARSEPLLLYRERNTTVSAEGTVTLSLPIPAALRGCQHLLVHASLTGAAARDTRWSIGSCTGSPAAPHVDFSFTAPAALREQTVDLWIKARTMPVGRAWQRRFRLDDVPANASLRLSYGVEPAGWEPGSTGVTFAVRVDGVTKPLMSADLDPAHQVEQRRWFDTTLPLDAFAGKSITLTLETTLAAMPSGTGFGVPAWGNPTILVEGATERPWNVLLISLDTMRARSLGAYGHTRPTSPVFDALAREGALFQTAVVQSTLTPNSHMSLFSARYPSDHGVTDLRRASDPDRIPTLPEQLRMARYATGAVTEDGLLQPALGFERGFDDYRENKSADLGSVTGQIERTFQDALQWMSDHRSVPFFLFVHTYQVHSPYAPPEPYRGALGPLNATGPEADRDRYEEEIQYTDAWLARLWFGVKDLGLADRTLLIVTSDHGEEFGEHGALDHGAQLYDETLLVPLLMRAPGLIPAALRVGEPVALIDVAPTVLELLKLPPLTHVPGQSLVGLFRDDDTIRRDTRSLLAQRFIYTEAWAATRMLVDGSLDPNWTPPIYALRSKDLKLVWSPALPSRGSPERLEAYDLEVDAGEKQDISASNDPRLPIAREALRAYTEAALKPTLAQPTPIAPADPATLEKLRALGYLR